MGQPQLAFGMTLKFLMEGNLEILRKQGFGMPIIIPEKKNPKISWIWCWEIGAFGSNSCVMALWFVALGI
jgi:hypothetical protein